MGLVLSVGARGVLGDGAPGPINLPAGTPVIFPGRVTLTPIDNPGMLEGAFFTLVDNVLIGFQPVEVSFQCTWKRRLGKGDAESGTTKLEAKCATFANDPDIIITLPRVVTAIVDTSRSSRSNCNVIAVSIIDPDTLRSPTELSGDVFILESRKFRKLASLH